MIPFIDLKRQYESIKKEIDNAILNVLENSNFILGPDVEHFEQEFASFCNTRYAVAVNSGTSALHLSLLVAGIERGDEVITTPFTFIATISAIAYVGAKPVFVDIDLNSLTIDTNGIEEKITRNTKAIIPVHLHGHPANMDEITKIAKKHNLKIIEDACQAHGAEYKKTKVGGIGDLGCFSFYPGKNLGGYGEGGIAVTNNINYFKRLRILRNWGEKKKHHHNILGYNYRMDGIQGAILRVKLKKLKHWINIRRQIAKKYGCRLKNTNIMVPNEQNYAKHVYHVYSIRVRKRNELKEHLNMNGIQTGMHYPVPLHLQHAFSYLGHHKGDFPSSEIAANEVLSLPIFPELTEDQIERVCSNISGWS